MSSYWNNHQNKINLICNLARDKILGTHDSEYCDDDPPRYMDCEYTSCGLTAHLLNDNLDSYLNEMIYSDSQRNTISTIISTFKEKLLHHDMLIISIETVGNRKLDHIFTLYQDENVVKIVDSYRNFWLPRIRDLNWVDFEDKLGKIINIIQYEPNGDEMDGHPSNRKKYMMVYTIWNRLWGLPVDRTTLYWFAIKDLRIKYWYPNT